MRHAPLPHAQRGTSLVEILVTMVILSFGLLGIAVFHVKAQVASLESYQRAQAVILLEDMHARISATPAQASAYQTAGTATLGTDGTDEDCTGKAIGAARDRCEWSAALRGAAEAKAGGTKVGAMIGARGCIEELQSPIPTGPGCRQGIYLVTIAWQGLHATRKPSQSCASGKYGTEAEGLRRAISTRVAVAVPQC
jgi:type IV pilus assembly protein PilV